MRKAILGLSIVAVCVVGCGILLRNLPAPYAVNFPAGTFLGGGPEGPDEAALGGRVRAPDGFSIGVYAEGLESPRWLRFTSAGDLLVSTPRSGRVMLLERDADGDGRADGTRVLLDGLNRPHGMDLRDGWLYVAETDAVGRIRFDARARATEGPFERVVTGLPGGGNHWTRTLRFGPDGLMYVSIGSSCNVCEEEDPRRAAIVRYRPDGGGEQIFATGLRNSVGFDWRPETGALYATDNGRDLLGDDFPPCELNRVEQGAFYGWPIANGDRVPDPDYGEGREERIAASVPPVHGFRAHTAPLGIAFVGGESLPPAYRGAALVALHGSWNRTRKDGYEVVSLHWDAGGSVREEPFVTGFELDEDVIGRPVDVAQGPDGAIYVSDDYAGAVYRVAWGERGHPPAAAAAPGPARLAEAGEAEEAAPLAGTAENARRGAALYAANACATCHEHDAAPEGTVVKPLEGLSARYDTDDLVAFLVAPTPPMPSYDQLSEAERRDLAVFLLRSAP